MMISHHFLTVCCSVYLNTVQLQFNSHTKTLDSVNFASNSFLQSSSISNKSLLMSILKTSMNKLFQLKYILLMIFPAFVRSGNCDKSQKLISYLLTKFYNLWWRLGESNSWPPACKAGALPTKLSPQLINKSMFLFSVFSIEQCLLVRFGGSDKTWTCDPTLIKRVL